MSSTKQRLARSGAGVARTTHRRGEARLWGIATPTNNAEAARTGSLRRPDSSILNDAIPLFAIGRNKAGLWVARDCDSAAGDVFLSKSAAIRFAKKTRGLGGCAFMFLANGLELDRDSSQAVARHSAVKFKIVTVFAAIKRKILNFTSPSK